MDTLDCFLFVLLFPISPSSGLESNQSEEYTPPIRSAVFLFPPPSPRRVETSRKLQKPFHYIKAWVKNLDPFLQIIGLLKKRPYAICLVVKLEEFSFTECDLSIKSFLLTALSSCPLLFCFQRSGLSWCLAIEHLKDTLAIKYPIATLRGKT